MHEIDKDGMMKVEFMGAIHRRPAIRTEYKFPLSGSAVSMVDYKPELREGEVLVEFIGRMPAIVKTGL